MSEKVLMAATVAPTIGQFNMDNIKILQGLGYEVHVACDFQDRSVWTTSRMEDFQKELSTLGVKYFQVDFSRSPLDMKRHVKAYRQLKAMMCQNAYAFVHCHTPVASAICRVAAHKTKTTCIYTAHGFHFYKGAPLKNWMIFYPVEWFLSRWTDILITINREDYVRADKHFKAGHVEYVPGVGVDLEKINSVTGNRKELRGALGISEEDVLLLSVGELSHRKNHETVIRSLKEINDPHIRYFICGQGSMEENLRRLVHELGLDNQVQLLGFRTDVYELYHGADLFVFPSYQEGLPVALMEAMACGLPCVASSIRGNIDLIEDGKGGCLCRPDDVAGFAEKIIQLLADSKMQRQCGEKNKKTIEAFDIAIINEKMTEIYEQCAKGSRAT